MVAEENQTPALDEILTRLKALEEGVHVPETSAEAERLAELFDRLKESNSATAQSLGNDVLLNLLLRNLTKRIEVIEQAGPHLREGLTRLEGGLRALEQVLHQARKDQDRRILAVETAQGAPAEDKPNTLVEKMFPNGFNQMNTSMLLLLCTILLLGILEMLGIEVVSKLLPFLDDIAAEQPQV